jgi:hypothetical protein
VLDVGVCSFGSLLMTSPLFGEVVLWWVLKVKSAKGLLWLVWNSVKILGIMFVSVRI